MYTARFGGIDPSIDTSFEFMLEDNHIAWVDIAAHTCWSVNRDLLPVAICRVPDAGLYPAIVDWLMQRALPVSRKNYTKITKACGLSSRGDIYTILNNFRGLSLVDNYWFRNNVAEKYSDVNLYENHFCDLLPVALLGDTGLSVQNSSPELNQHGVLAKCYKRENNQIFIYKTSSQERIQAECFASKLAAVCEFATVHYAQVHCNKVLCSKCAIETSVDINWVPAGDLSKAGFNPVEVAVKLTPNRYYQMLLFDYLVGNIDRHNENWSFEMTNSGEIIGLTKMYDFDNAFLAGSSTVSKVTMHPLLTDAITAYGYLQPGASWITRVRGFLNSVPNNFSNYAKCRLNDLLRSV